VLRQGAKLQVSTDRIKLLERELNAANDKYQKLEEKYQESDACKIRNEISRLKGSVVELESVLKREMAEKNVLASEQERYRTAAHKLVSSLVLCLDFSVCCIAI
jgi:chromosome segregation ATPase